MTKFYNLKEACEIFGEKTTLISTGAYSKVYNTEHSKVVKILQTCDNKDPIDFIRELIVSNTLNHPNIAKIIGYSKIDNKRYLFMDKANYSLHDLMTSGVKYNKKLMIYQLLLALDYCHSNKIIHRDVKPQNILIFDGQLQLSDFGICKTHFSTEESHSGDTVTIWWRAPEVLLGSRKYTSAIDIWSVGVIFLTMILGYDPFTGMTTHEQLNNIFKLLGTPSEFSWNGVSNMPNWNKNIIAQSPIWFYMNREERDLIFKLLAWEPHRISATDALQHSYFDSIRYPPPQIMKINLYSFTRIPRPESHNIILHKIIELAENFQLNYNILLLAFYIFDKFAELSKTTATITHGIVSLMIAAYIRHTDYQNDYEKITLLDKTDYISIENEILETIQYTIEYTTILQLTVDEFNNLVEKHLNSSIFIV